MASKTIDKEKLKISFDILFFFFKIGFFTFGGGWSILKEIKKEFVDKRGSITDDELMEITSVARSLPGIMIANISVIFGYRMGGSLCALCALFGITAPSVIVLSVITLLYSKFSRNIYVERALAGVRAAVVPIIASAAFSLRKTALYDMGGYIIAIVTVMLALFTDVSNIIIVVLGALLGLLIVGVKSRWS